MRVSAMMGWMARREQTSALAVNDPASAQARVRLRAGKLPVLLVVPLYRECKYTSVARCSRQNMRKRLSALNRGT